MKRKYWFAFFVKTKQQPLQDKEWATDNFRVKFNQKQIKVFLIAQFFLLFRHECIRQYYSNIIVN